jgi:hypothetical protein
MQRVYLLDKANKVNKAEGGETRYKDLKEKEALPKKMKNNILKAPMGDFAV